MVTLTDEQILELIREPKPLPDGLLSSPPKMAMRNRFLRRDFDFVSDGGRSFVIKLRQSTENFAEFSVILGYRLPGFNKVFILRRYNGKHQHTNPIENEKFRDFHRHTATERYQRRGCKDEHFAEVDKRFSNMEGAIQCLLRDCAFQIPEPPLLSLPLFGGPLR